MPPKKKAKKSAQNKLRDIAWEIGKVQPGNPDTDHIALLMITPHRGHVYWHIQKKIVDKLAKKLESKCGHTSLVIRIHDVTDIMFDGTNASAFFDLEVGAYTGNYYFQIHRTARNYIAEAGLRAGDGSFHSLVRSATKYFEGSRPSGNYDTKGLFVSSKAKRLFPVENIFDAPVFDNMNRLLAGVTRKAPLSVAKVYLNIHNNNGPNGQMESFIKSISENIVKFGGNSRLFSAQMKTEPAKSATEKINSSSLTLYRKLKTAHDKTPFHLVHCHNWSASKVGLSASKKLGLPMVLTLYSTEFERSSGSTANPDYAKICSIEQEAVLAASLVIVPNSSTQQQVINMYSADPDKVVIIPHIFQDQQSDTHTNSDEVKRRFGLIQHAPIVLFAGEISHAAGADIMVEALPTVYRNHSNAQYVFAGDGPLKGELESRSWSSGIGEKCHFIGHVPGKDFEALLLASDFIVIPARTWQDDGVARMAISHGRPVLTTQQSGISCVKHGENGLVTFDNPGSIVWGIQEMLANPLHGSMLSIVARKNAGEPHSHETIAARHYMHYEQVLKIIGGENA